MTTVIAVQTHTAAELAYLTALLGGNAFLGVPDPFHGWLAVEVEEALARARASLLDRGLIHLLPDGTIGAAPETAHMIQTCTRPDASFRLTCTTAGAPVRDVFIHTGQGEAVEVTVEEQGARCRLAAVTSMTDQVLLRLGIAGQSAPPCAGAEFQETILRRTLELAEEGRTLDVHELLLQVGVTAGTAAALAATLAGGIGTGVLVRLTRGQPEAAGVGFLTGATDLWEMHPVDRGGEAWVAVSHCGAERAAALVSQVLQYKR